MSSERMSVASYNSKLELAERCWKELCALRRTSLTLEIIEGLADQFPHRDGDTTPEAVGEFLSSIVKTAWMSGFADGLSAIETGAVVISSEHNN